MRQFIPFDLHAQSVPINPANVLQEDALGDLLRKICKEGLSAAEQSEVEDQIEALVPALVELREAGHLKLNMAVIAQYGTLDGFIHLADDQRLSDLSRRRCKAIRDRMLAHGVKAILGHK